MVFDVDKLKEALADLEDVKVALEVSGEWDENDTDAVALEVLRMVAAGQPLRRCEIHGSSASIFSEQCDTGAFLSADAEGKGFDVDEDDCVMVEGWWMPTGKDET